MPACEDRAGLVAVERAALAEDVDPARVRRAGVEHLALHELDVGVGVVLGRDHVCAQEGSLVGARRGDREAAALVGNGQPVAGLGLDGRGAGAQRLGDQPVQVGAELRRRWRCAWPSTVVRMPPACRARRPSARRTPARGRRRRRGGRGSRRSRGSRRGRPRRSARSPAASGVCARGPAHCTTPSPNTIAAFSIVPSSGSFVTSVPMLSISTACLPRSRRGRRRRWPRTRSIRASSRAPPSPGAASRGRP